MKNKKGMIESVADSILYIGIVFVVIIFFLAVISPTIFERSEDLYSTQTANATVLNETTWNLPYNNYVEGSATCTNYTGGTATNTVHATNYTITASTITFQIQDNAFNNTNIQCTYQYAPGSYGNVSGGIENLSIESTSLIPVAFGIIALILILIAIVIFRRQN